MMCERIDILKQGNYRIIQNPEKFCFGIDALLLAAFADARKKDKVFDLGTGTGIIPLVMNWRTEADHFTALEVQAESADMARRSVALNSLEEKIEVIEGDIKNVRQIFLSRVCDVVTSNPPYMTLAQGKVSPKDAKSIARSEVLCNLENVVSAADYLLKQNGKFFMIHRPNRLTEIFVLCRKYNLEPKRMQLIYPFKDKKPTMVLLEARHDAKPDLIVEEPLVMYEKPGIYTEKMLSLIEGNVQANRKKLRI